MLKKKFENSANRIKSYPARSFIQEFHAITKKSNFKHTLKSQCSLKVYNLIKNRNELSNGKIWNNFVPVTMLY